MTQEPSRVRFMSPREFEPFDGIPGVCAVARDANLRLLWCNAEFARLHDKQPSDMIGTTVHELLPKDLLDERRELLQPALRGDEVVAFYQMWRGRRQLTRAWPLDPHAFGVPGIFIMISPAPEPASPDGLPVAETSEMNDLSVLSPRELEVLYHLATGLTAKEIAQKLDRSAKTVERHIESIHQKLGFSNRASVVRFAVERGILGFREAEWQKIIRATTA